MPFTREQKLCAGAPQTLLSPYPTAGFAIQARFLVEYEGNLDRLLAGRTGTPSRLMSRYSSGFERHIRVVPWVDLRQKQKKGRHDGETKTR